MSIALGLNLSTDLSNRSGVFTRFSQYLKSGFNDIVFPDNVDSIAIGVICVDPKFDAFFKPRKPKLIKNETYKDHTVISHNRRIRL